MARNSSIVLDIAAKIDKSWRASLNNVSTDIRRLSQLVSANMRQINANADAIENYKKKLESLHSKRAELMAKLKSNSFVTKDKITDTEAKLKAARTRGDTEQEGILQAQLNSLRSFENIKDTSKYKSAIRRINEAIDNYETKINEANATTNKATKNIGQAFQYYFANIATKAITGLISAFNTLGRTALKTLGKLAGVFSRTVSRAIGLEQAIKLIVQYGFGFRSLYYLIRRLRTGIEQGFEYLGGAIKSSKKQISGFSEEVGKLVETVRELVYYLKSAGAAMLQPFMPLINSIIPKLVAWFNALAIAVANFIATLTGQSKIYVASTNLEDYANALDSVAGSADKAREALGAYDKLNVISDDKNKGGGSGGMDTSGWFTEQATEPSKLAEMIKKAWEDADFTEVGKYIGEKFRDMLASIEWDDKVYPMVEKIATCFATLFNGFISVAGLGAEIGKAVANLLNGIALYVETFVSTFNWGDFGRFIVEGINSFLKNIDASLFGQALHDFANGILDMLGRIFADEDGLDTNTLGQRIGEFFGALQLGDLASKFVEVAKQIAKGIADALLNWAQTDPESFGLATALVTASALIKTVELAIPIALTLGQAGLIDLSGLFGEDGLLSHLPTLKELLNDVAYGFTHLWEVMQAHPIAVILTAIGLLVAAFIHAYSTNEEFRQSVDDLCNNTIKPAFDAMGRAVSDLWNNNLKPLWNNLKDLTTSILDMLRPILDFIVQSFVPFIVKNLKGLVTSVTPIIGAFVDVISSILGVLNGVIEFVTGIFSNDWDMAWKGIEDIFDSFGEGIVAAMRTAVNLIVGIFNSLFSGICSAFNSITSTISSVGGWISKTISTFTGGKVSFNAGSSVPTLQPRSIPALAQGAVIPPNRQFIAMLGDQTSGTNIEAPLDTIKQALVEALSDSANTSPIVLQLDGKTIAKAVWDENDKRYKQLGKYAY